MNLNFNFEIEDMSFAVEELLNTVAHCRVACGINHGEGSCG